MASVVQNSFSHRLTVGQNTFVVQFVLHPIRSSNFEVLVQDAAGKLHSHQPAAARTYLGRVANMQGALAAGLVRADGTVLCQIALEGGWEFIDSTGSGVAIVRGDSNWQPNNSNLLTVGLGGAGSHVFAAEVGVDATFDQFTAAGSSVAATLEMVEFSVMAANIPFLRDAAILHRLGKVVVRASNVMDPYVAIGGQPNALLLTVRQQWTDVLPVGTTHHLAVVVTPRLTLTSTAFLGGIGTNLGYAANAADSNGYFAVHLRGAAGVIWGGLPQENSAEGPTILSGNLLSRFSSADVALILAERRTKDALFQNLGRYAFPLPPRANIDHTVLNTGLQVTLKISVLANDSHSSGHPLSLFPISAPFSSALGGIVFYSSASNHIIYTPPVQLASGAVDYFPYRIVASDELRSTATGYVTVQAAADDDLVAHWALDEGNGSVAYDSSASQNNGAVVGRATWVAGHIRGAISLDGTTGEVIASRGLNISTNTITITGWVRCNGAQANVAGLALCRDRPSAVATSDTTSAGLHLFGPANELRYHWGTSNNPSFNFSSGLTLRDAQWTFVALVITPTQATLYKKEPQGELEAAQTAVGSITFEPQSFQGPFVLGNDAMVEGRHFKGDMDDFRIFRRALTQGEISLLAESSSEGVDSTAPRLPTRTQLLGSSEDLTYTGPLSVGLERITCEVAKAP